MALQIQSPYIHVEDANGNPYVGAQLTIYLAGTTTLAPVYTNEALSTSADNPAESDAAGNFPRIYIAAGTYKLRCETAGGILIFEEDNIDTGLSAGTGALPISRGGTGGTTAAAARSNLDVPSNSELAALSDQITTLQSSLQNISAFPQGYLTLTTGTPVITGDVAAATSVYYTPFIGNLVPIWNGTSTVVTPFTELTLVLNSNHTASSIYDLFVINDAGTIRLVSGPAWNTVTIGAGARGSGAGTTELTRSVAGILTNANAITGRYGATTVSVDANKATFVGSMYMDGTNGQVTCHRTYGVSRKFGISNAYNQRIIRLKAGDPAASWSVGGGGSVRAQNNSTANSLTSFRCLADGQVFYRLNQTAAITPNQATSATTGYVRAGIGFNVTNAFTGKYGTIDYSGSNMSASYTFVQKNDVVAQYTALPAIGIDTATACESFSNSLSQTLYGTEANCSLTAEWMG